MIEALSAPRAMIDAGLGGVLLAFEHIGKEHAAQSRIDHRTGGGKCFDHGDSLKLLSPAQQFAVDLGDRLQDFADSLVVGKELRNLIVRLLRYVVHLRPQARVAHRKIVLGAMTGAVGALASWFATSFVALDERTAKDRLERWQLAQKCSAAFSQCGGGFVGHFCQTTCLTGLIVFGVNSCVNPFCDGWRW